MELYFNKIGNGPPLFIIHGLYGSGDNWFNIAKMLAKNFTVYLIDQRNHGQSPHSPIHNYEEMANDLKILTDSLEIQELNIIGHSMGGKTAMTFALQNGHQVNKLINVDISPYSYHGLKHFSEQYSFHKSIIDCFETAPISHAHSRQEIEDFFATTITNTKTRRFLLKNLKREKNGQFSWKLNVQAIANNLNNIIDAAPPIKLGARSYIECLFIRGGKSPYISDEDIESIGDVFPNSRFLTYEKSGHWLHSEEPERFLKDVSDFLI